MAKVLLLAEFPPSTINEVGLYQQELSVLFDEPIPIGSLITHDAGKTTMLMVLSEPILVTIALKEEHYLSKPAYLHKVKVFPDTKFFVERKYFDYGTEWKVLTFKNIKQTGVKVIGLDDIKTPSCTSTFEVIFDKPLKQYSVIIPDSTQHVQVVVLSETQSITVISLDGAIVGYRYLLKVISDERPDIGNFFYSNVTWNEI